MALIRRCGRLLWIRTKLPKLIDKYNNHVVDKINPNSLGYVLQLQIQLRTSSQYKANESYSTSNIERNISHNPETSSDLNETTEMCYADVEKLVDENSLNVTLKDQSFAMHLLKSCRDMLPDAELSRRQDLVRRAWNIVENVDETLTVEHYNILLSIYARNSQYFNAEEFLNTMRVKPDKDTYRLLTEALAEVGDHGQILRIMEKVKDAGYSINEAMFNALILAYMISADVDGAQGVMNAMQAAMIEMSPATYCALSRGYAAGGDLTNLKRSLNAGNLNPKQLMLVVKSLSNSGHGEYIHLVMKHLPKIIDVQSNDVVCTIVELTHLGKAGDALEVINCLPRPEKHNDSSTNALDFFLCVLVESETPTEKILEICENLIASGRHPSSLLRVTEVALRSKKEETALLAFKALQNHGVEIRPHFYWPLLADAGHNKAESDVIRVIKHMTNNKVYLDDETLKYYMIRFLSSTSSLITVRKLQDCGIKISEILTPLLVTLLTKGDLKEAALLSHKITGKIDKAVVIESLLHGYLKAKDINAAADILKNIKSNDEQNGNFLLDILANRRVIVTNDQLKFFISAFDKRSLKISKDSAEVLKPRINRIREPENFFETFKRIINTEKSTADKSSHPFIPHPRYMNAEQLESHFIDLLNNGHNTRGVLRRLIQTHCSKNNLIKAVEFAEIFDEKGFDWTTGMLCGMFSLYANNNKLDEAETRYQELKTKYSGFKIDDHKIIDYATVLVENNKLEKALEVLAEQQIVRHGPGTIRNCWRLLNAVAASGDSENVRATLDLLIFKGYCKIDTHVLGPLVRTHLVNGDLKAAVKEFKECVQTHRKTPLQQELLRAVVKNCTHELEDQEQLTAVLTEIKRIHGDVAANSHLFMALAATDRQKELHTLIKMPAVDHSMLRLCAEKLTDEENLAALQTILKACRGAKRLDTAILYDSIMNLCARSGDYQTALNMWEKMQTEDVIPPLKFMQKLKNLLESEQIQLPPDLELNKRKIKG